MDNRGLLDLIISLLSEIRITEKIQLIKAFECEEDLFLQSRNDIEMIINRRLKNFWDVREIQDKAGCIDTTCRMRGIK